MTALPLGACRRNNKRKEMAEEKILIKHPLGKSEKNIDRQKYEAFKKAILSTVQNKELTHDELFNRLNTI